MTAVLAQEIPPCAFTAVGDVQDACDQIRGRLAEVAGRGDIPAILACRDAADDVRAAVCGNLFGAEGRLIAEELQRRCERAIGVALRGGQAAGTIASHGRPGPRVAGRPSPTDYVSRNDLYPGGNGRSAGIYDLTDGITDEAFEAALGAGRAEGVLTRVGVARRLGFDHVVLPRHGRRPAAPKVHGAPDPGDRSFVAIGRRLDVIREMAGNGSTSEQIADVIGRSAGYIRDLARGEGIVISGDQVTRKGRSHDSRRVVGETVAALEGLAMGVGLVDLGGLGDLDRALIQGWVTSLARSLPVLTRMRRDLTKEITQ